jgi:hypothetical protein
MDPSAGADRLSSAQPGRRSRRGLPSRATCATLTRMAKKSPPKSAMKPAPKANNPPPAKPAPKKGGRKR